MFQVFDREGNVIAGDFSFDCDGYKVSCSTIMRPSILIFKGSEIIHQATSVTDAVLWCWANKKCEEVCPKNCLHCQEPCAVRI